MTMIWPRKPAILGREAKTWYTSTSASGAVQAISTASRTAASTGAGGGKPLRVGQRRRKSFLMLGSLPVVDAFQADGVQFPGRALEHDRAVVQADDAVGVAPGMLDLVQVGQH